MPEAARTLFELARLKRLAQSLGVKKIRAGDTGGALEFTERAAVDPIRLVSLVEDEPESFRLDGPFRLRIRWALDADEDRLAAVAELLVRLGAAQPDAAAA